MALKFLEMEPCLTKSLVSSPTPGVGQADAWSVQVLRAVSLAGVVGRLGVGRAGEGEGRGPAEDLHTGAPGKEVDGSLKPD